MSLNGNWNEEELEWYSQIKKYCIWLLSSLCFILQWNSFKSCNEQVLFQVLYKGHPYAEIQLVFINFVESRYRDPRQILESLDL